MGSHGSAVTTESVLGHRKPQNDPIRGVPNKGVNLTWLSGASKGKFGAHCEPVRGEGGLVTAATQITPGALGSRKVSMSRAQYNTLILLYRWRNEDPEYGVFWRRSGKMCQFIAGGGEDDESPRVAAMREVTEETGLAVREEDLLELDSRASLPRSAFSGVDWADDVYVIPEYTFALHVDGARITLSHEHERFEWLKYAEAKTVLTWDSNRVALFELHHRLTSRRSPGS